MKKSKLLINLILLSAFNLAHAKNEEQKSEFITNIKQLTFAGAKSGEGYFSADGKKMIYQSDRDLDNPFYQIYVVDLANGNSERISTGSGKTTCGWIHPNLKQALWSSSHLDPDFKKKKEQELENRKKLTKEKYSWSFDEHFDIFSSDLQGKNVKRLTKTLGYDAEASYSNDGKWIAFASNRSAYIPENQKKWTDLEKKMFVQDTSYFMDIYIMKTDGSEVVQLTNDAGYDGGPFFSADSKKITWRKFSPDGSKAEIFTMNIDGSDKKQLTNLKSMSWAPYFHPSGKYVIFTSSILGYHNFELFIVDVDGKKEPVRVSFQEGFDGLPTFTPDGEKLSWTRKNEKGESQIYWADWNHQAALKSLGLPTEERTLNGSSLKSEIRKRDVIDIVKYLASEEMKGRMTGSPEEELYMSKIADLFRLWNLDVKIQKFEFVSSVKLGENNTAAFKGAFTKNLELGKNYQVVSNSASGKFHETPVVFAGFGILADANSNFAGYNSYRDLDVKGKWVMMFEGEPLPTERDLKKHAELLPYTGQQHKITVAKNQGASGVIFVAPEKSQFDFKYEGKVSGTTIPVIRISQDLFGDLLKQVKPEESFKKLIENFNSYESKTGFAIPSVYLAAQVELKAEVSKAQNVIGVLNPKNKKSQKNKAFILGAHGDHLGLGQTGSSLAKGDQKGKIHYGADDNASGVAGVLELAHYYSENRDALRRPIYFAVWSGEELGVLGSNEFVKKFKENFGKDFSSTFMASFNLDMIGRLNDKNELNVQGIGSSDNWPIITEKVAFQNKDMNLQLNVTSDPYLPTDAMSFYLGKIPSISFFTGAHQEYHTPLDVPETLNYDGLVDSIKIVKSFIQETDTYSNLKYVSVASQAKNMEGRKFRLFLGTIPDYTQEGVKGVKISGVTKDSPAEKAGLQGGDVITEFDKIKIDNIYDYVYTLQTVKPNVKTNIKVKRGSEELELEVTPSLKE